MNEIPSPYTQGMNDLRMIVFIEAHPFSNHYHQFKLTKEQYSKLSDFLYHLFPLAPGQVEPNGFRNVQIVDDGCVDLPEDLSAWHDKND